MRKKVAANADVDLIALVNAPVAGAVLNVLRRNGYVMRQCDLARQVREATDNAGCGDSLVRYHLKRLERHGLVRCISRPQKFKAVCLVRDVRVRVHVRRVLLKAKLLKKIEGLRRAAGARSLKLVF